MTYYHMHTHVLALRLPSTHAYVHTYIYIITCIYTKDIHMHMNRKQHTELATMLTTQLLPMVGKHNIDNIVVHIAPTVATIAIAIGETPDEIDVHAIGGSYHPTKVLLVQLIRSLAWTHYYDMVDKLAC